MHRVLQPFEFFEPTTVEKVVELVDGRKSMVLAGGVDLILKMRRRDLLPEKVVSLQKVPGLDYIDENGSGLKFGALTTLRQIEQAQIVKQKFPLLNEAISKIVSVQTKTMGTAVGNLCVATPASDVAPPLYAMGAKIKITGKTSKRELPIEDFFVALGQTALKPHEIVTEIVIPALSSGSGTAFLKLSKTAEDIAKVNVAVMVTLADGKCHDAKIAVGSVAPTPIRAVKAEAVMKGEDMDKGVIGEAAEAAAEAASPISDVRSTAEYRKEMVRVLVRDALETAFARAQA
jgi:carbon-monoxide dehydrogenase medium subunit